MLVEFRYSFKFSTKSSEISRSYKIFEIKLLSELFRKLFIELFSKLQIKLSEAFKEIFL